MSLITPLLLFFGIWQSFLDMMSALMQPLYWAVSGLVVLFHKVFSPLLGVDSGWSWTLAIVSLTVVIRTLLIPIFVKQINSARNMQLVQPKMKALQEKFGHDRERLGQETMKLYREEGVNPAASCLPLLLQMPIFLALFRVLEGASRGIPRGTFFKNHPELMTSLQNADVFGARLAGRFLPLSDGFGATQVLSLVLIVGMTSVLFITQMQLMQKNMPPEALTGPMAQQQKMMLYLLPVVFAVAGVSMPIGVLMYWLTTNIWTMAQQYILIHNNPAPNTPAYVDWEERMRAKGENPREIEAARNKKRQRKVFTETPSAIVVDEDGAERQAVARQSVSRQTVRKTTSGGKSVVSRQQPQRQSRASRKK